jgi:hypothetical protein
VFFRQLLTLKNSTTIRKYPVKKIASNKYRSSILP